MDECEHGNTACYHCSQCGYCLAMLRSELDRLTAALAASESRERELDKLVGLAISVCEARAEGFPIEKRLDKLHEALVRKYTLGEASPAPSALSGPELSEKYGFQPVRPAKTYEPPEPASPPVSAAPSAEPPHLVPGFEKFGPLCRQCGQFQQNHERHGSPGCPGVYEPKPVRIERSKEWWLAKAREETGEVGAGSAAPPTPPPQTVSTEARLVAGLVASLPVTESMLDEVANMSETEIARTLADLRFQLASLRTAPPPEELTAEREPSCRERRLAKLCGDKKLVLAIRPKGYGGWLYLERAEDVVDHMIEGEPNDEWELKWALMTQAEIDAMPEHEGW